LLLLPFPPLLFFYFSCVPCGDNEKKNPYRDRATIWLNFRPACIHFLNFLILVFLSHTLFPFKPPHRPQLFPAFVPLLSYTARNREKQGW
jgi:hypothetical protein